MTPAPTTLDDMPPAAALTLLILYHNQGEGEMPVSRLHELIIDAIAEHGSVDLAIKALRPNKREKS